MKPSLAIAFLVLVSAAPSSAGEPALPFIADDYAHARAEATQRELPLFVEVWAPW
jgi:hypothetical protein